MNEEKTYRISEISLGIQVALQETFPEKLWILGEIQGLDRSKHGKHWYFQLCETVDEGEVYRLSATIWNSIHRSLFGPRGKLKGIMDPGEDLDGIKIRALCRLDFYAPYGKISLQVQDIDPAYTLGDLEAKRQAVLEKLSRLGILHKNKELPLEEVPLTLGLVTSAGSAAYSDFIKELENSGFAFRILLCDARMQGEEAPATIRAALKTLDGRKVDAIVLIRGGGSRLDLSWFDREEVVSGIIQCSCPVITGIGHEIDVTLCEMAAHTGLKTPTAAAAFLKERVTSYMNQVMETASSMARSTTQWIEREELSLKYNVTRFAGSIRVALTEERGFLRDVPRKLFAAVRFFHERSCAFLNRAGGRLRAGRHMQCFEESRVRLSRAVLNLNHFWSRRCEREEHRLILMAERCRLLDPQRTVRRGYALLKDPSGKAIKSVEILGPEDRFTAVVRDGRIEAEVVQIEKEEAHGKKEKRQLEIW